MAAASYVGHVLRERRDRGERARHPTQVCARSTGTTRSASPSRSRTTSRAAATSAAVGGSECRQRSVSRTHPMSAEKRPRRRSVAQHHLGRSATEVDDDERRSGGIQFADRAVERQRGLLVAGDHLGHAPGTTAPSTSAVIAKNSSRLAASRVADVATIRTRRNVELDASSSA